MAKVGAQRAAELTGKSKSTIQRAMNSGKISYEMDANKRKVVDVAELERAFGLISSQSESKPSSSENEMQKISEMLEMERMKMRVKMLEEQLDAANSQIEDMKEQRDQWQKQAQQVLITSRYSQKRAEELQEEIKGIELKEAERRKQMMQARMKKMQGENQNADEVKPAKTSSMSKNTSEKSSPAKEETTPVKGTMMGVWDKIKKVASN